MILELKRQGLGVSAIARQTGLDRKTVRKYLERGLPPRSGKLVLALIQEVYAEAGGTGRRIGLLTGTEDGGAGEDATAEQHAPGPTGQGGRDQRGDVPRGGRRDSSCPTPMPVRRAGPRRTSWRR
jgi:hypothetical protein